MVPRTLHDKHAPEVACILERRLQHPAGYVEWEGNKYIIGSGRAAYRIREKV
ncbi:hypothetical protein JI435_408800 [Parastagonospora nodorum SN15]|uniref:Uncharacterized protein n=1 Tax=Phaeosphaeria nodorum (strain SN15 / ATCC MYA-4574 / FGSC 10173) TaxID=321614 RepID=A0A7U2F0P7_PHANO|nr:hypothetical protein JI435_408800 [Parastagonospora nodorum SN15]